MGVEAENCDIACTNKGLTCDQMYMHSKLPDVASHSKMSAILSDLSISLDGVTCTGSWGSSADVPVIGNGQCLHGDVSRSLDTVVCSHNPPSNKRRLCWCTGDECKRFSFVFSD